MHYLNAKLSLKKTFFMSCLGPLLSGHEEMLGHQNFKIMSFHVFPTYKYDR
jgi:hypothetical protein